MKFLGLLSGIILIILFLSCGKGLTTKPQISIESITTIIPFQGEFNATLKFSDKQGDLGGATFTAIIIPTNILLPPGGIVDTAIINDTIPSFPNSPKGEFLFTLPWSSFHQQVLRNDSCLVKFFVIDRAGNMSDTITSPAIIALYQ
jgi:hypothetical protein